MADTLTLTPEQLFFLGILMDAQYIDYAYIASLQEIRRNYTRTRRKCLSELAEAGVLRERLSGEITLRPGPKQLLSNLFFGKDQSSLEVYTLGKKMSHSVFRFHRLGDAVTRVSTEDGRLTLSQSSPEEMEQLVSALVRGTEQPMSVIAIEKGAVTRMITAKHATVDVGSTGCVLFEQPGGLYTVDENGKPVALPASQARRLILSELKGE